VTPRALAQRRHVLFTMLTAVRFRYPPGREPPLITLRGGAGPAPPGVVRQWPLCCLAAADIRGDFAELYGYVNRALPDAELDAFVDALALRISSFDKQAIADTKRLVNVASLKSDAEIAPEWDAFMASLGRPASQNQIKTLMSRGLHKAGDVETRLGYHVGQLGG